MLTKEQQQEIVATLRQWQKVEDGAVVSTGQVIMQTDNPIIRLIMEIIQHDSQTHRHVQKWIADSLESTTVTFSADELADVWKMIERHTEIEKKMLASAEQMLERIDKGMLVQRYLLEYLIDDERKHERLLSGLESLKKGMYS
jgi:hypothetical protein